MSMAKRISPGKPSTIDHAPLVPQFDLSRYSADLENWPRSWMGWEKDLPPGEKLVACFRPFIEHLASSGLSRKTIRKHIDNLWILGGEIIRDLNETPSLRKKRVEHILLDVIDDEGGPLIHNCDSEEQQRSFDSTCRKFRRFLSCSGST
jgi:hypothetical protein